MSRLWYRMMIMSVQCLANAGRFNPASQDNRGDHDYMKNVNKKQKNEVAYLTLDCMQSQSRLSRVPLWAWKVQKEKKKQTHTIINNNIS